MDFMTFLTTDEAKKRLLEQYHMENVRYSERITVDTIH